MIEKCTHSNYSHSGIVMKNPNFINKKGLYILESTGFENVPDVEDGKIKFGVQLRDLNEVLNDFEGSIYVRSLECKRDSKFYNILTKAHAAVHNKPYDVLDYFSVFLKDDLHVKIEKLKKENTFFCSALCAYLYTKWGFLDIDWTTVTPGDLSSKGNLVFSNCILSTEKLLK